MAGADVNRIGFALKEYRTTAPIEDLQVFSRHPLAVETDYNTLFRNEADATTFGNQILALRKVDRWNWACFIVRGAYPTLEVGQTITLTYPRYSFNNGADFILKKIRRDAGALFDEIVLFGPKGLDFSQQLFALDFKNNEYWLNGTRYLTLASFPGYYYTRLGEQGARDIDLGIDYFAATVPAINGKGYHAYEGHINRLPYSQDFTQDYLLDVTVTVNTVKAPDGTMTMDKMIPSATNTPNHIFGRLANYGPGTWTQSIFVKAAELTRLFMGAYDGTTWHSVGFDLAAGTVLTTGIYGGAKGYIHDYGNGIYRCVLITTTTGNYGTTSGVVFYPKPAAALAQDHSFAGSGSAGLYAWQRQLIGGSFPDGGPIIRTPTGAQETLYESQLLTNLKPDGSALTGDFSVEGVVSDASTDQTRRFGLIYNSSVGASGFWFNVDTANNCAIYGIGNAYVTGIPGINLKSEYPFAFLYSFEDATNTLIAGVRTRGKTVISTPISSLATNASGLNRLNADVANANSIIKYMGVRAGYLTPDQITARLAALLGE